MISPATYNGRTGLMLCCPLTSQIKTIPSKWLLAVHAATSPSPTRSKIWTGGRLTRRKRERQPPKNWMP
ncbi:hypothetical protein ACP4QI_011005 [Leclercia sp. TB492]|uniref:hypothetical protein n=1 Tax=Leclercia sp. TB492 TaxID=3412682 RepID=UPI003CE8C9AE